MMRFRAVSMMQCPECGGKGRVTSTFNHGLTLLRYRQCRLCNHKWKAWEEIDPNAVRKYPPRKPVINDMFAPIEKEIL